MTLASNLCGFQISEAQLDLLVTIYEGIIKKEGDFSVRDAAEIKAEVETREQQRIIEKKNRKSEHHKNNLNQPRMKVLWTIHYEWIALPYNKTIYTYSNI